MNSTTYKINHSLSEKLKTKANEDNINEWYRQSWLKENNIKFIDYVINHGKE